MGTRLPDLEYTYTSFGKQRGGRIELDDHMRFHHQISDTGKKPLVVVSDRLLPGRRLTGFTSHREIPVKKADMILVSIEKGVSEVEVAQEIARVQELVGNSRRAQIIVQLPISENVHSRIQTLSTSLSALPERVVSYTYGHQEAQVIRFRPAISLASQMKRRVA